MSIDSNSDVSCIKLGQIMGRTGTNNELNWIDRVEQVQIMVQAGSNRESMRVDIVKQSQFVGQKK